MLPQLLHSRFFLVLSAFCVSYLSALPEDHMEKDYYSDTNPEFEEYEIHQYRQQEAIFIQQLTAAEKRFNLAMIAVGLIAFIASLIICMHLRTKKFSGIKNLV